MEGFLFSQNHQLLHIMLCDFVRDHPYEKSRDVCSIKCSNKIEMTGTDHHNISRKSCYACSYSEFLLKQKVSISALPKVDLEFPVCNTAVC